MSYQYQDAQGNPYVRGWGNDFTDAEKQKYKIGQYREDLPTTMTGDTNPNRIPFPGPGFGTGVMTQGPAGQQQAPRPEGFQRVATGIADWLTGNNWDFDQRGTGAKFLNEITKVGKDPNGNTFSENVPNMAPLPELGIDPLDILMQVPAPGQGTGGGKRYNPYEGQTITLPDGRVVERTPENSVPGP